MMKYELNFKVKMVYEGETPAVQTEEELKQGLIELLLDESDAKSVDVIDLNLMEIK